MLFLQLKLVEIFLMDLIATTSAVVLTSVSMSKTSFLLNFDFTRVNGCLNFSVTATSNIICSGICLSNSTCSGYIFTAPSNCQLLTYALGTPSAPSNANMYYASVIGANSVDVARGKTVTAATYYGYAAATTTVSGIACGAVDMQCWFSNMYTYTLKIDLGAVFNIKRIVVTRYSFWPNYIVNTFVYVGNTGSPVDPQFGLIGNFPGTKIQLTGSLAGRYILLKRVPLDSSFTLGFCLVEAFEN